MEANIDDSDEGEWYVRCNLTAIIPVGGGKTKAEAWAEIVSWLGYDVPVMLEIQSALMLDVMSGDEYDRYNETREPPTHSIAFNEQKQKRLSEQDGDPKL